MPVEAPPAPAQTAPVAPAAPAPSPAPAPAAPAPKPAAPARPAGPAAKSGAPVSRPSENITDAYSQLEAMGRPESELDTPPKPLETPPEKPEEAPETPPETPKPEEVKPPQKPEKAATLRENYERLKAQLIERDKELTILKEERAKAPVDDAEKKSLAEKVADYEKKLADVEDKLRFTNYEESAEYKDKYWQPFSEAYAQGRAKVSSLNLTDENGTVRQGTAADFDALMQVGNDNDAAEMAANLFGNKAPMVLWHREKVAELNRARVGALEDFKKNGAQRKAQEIEKFQSQQKTLVTEATELWKKSVSEPYERLPKYFKPVEGDTKGNELLQKGFEQATKAFKVMQVFDPSLTPEQRQEAIKGHAVVFNKAAAFDRLAYMDAQKDKRIKELSDQLKQYEDSTPTGGTSGRRNGKPVQHGSALDTADAALAALAGR